MTINKLKNIQNILFTFSFFVCINIAFAQANKEQIFYYYKGEKIFFDISYQQLIVGMKSNIIFNEIQKEVSKTIDIPLDSIKETQPGKQFVIKLKNTDKQAAINIVSKLKTLNNILYARPVFVSQSGNFNSYGSEFVVKLKPTTSFLMLNELIKNNNCLLIRKYPFQEDIFIIEAGKNANYDGLKMANLFYETGLFDYAEPDKVVYDALHVVPNDPLNYLQWAHNNTGTSAQYSGTPGIDMKIQSAWDVTMGESYIKIGVIDQGVDLTHPDLQANLLQGYNAVTLTSNVGDGAPLATANAHGTNCAGIIAAVANNGIGMAGVAPNCKIIPANVCQSTGTFVAESNIAAAFDYVRLAGADVISNSWGGGAQSSTLDAAFLRAVTLGRNGKGCVVLFSSGNGNASSVSYPSSNVNVIAVGGVSMCNQRKSTTTCDGETNWGANYGTGLGVIAPCVKIVSTDIQGTGGYNTTSGTSGNYFNTFNGTSSACPNAAGVVALILSADSSLTNTQATQILERTCNKLPAYAYTTTTANPNGSWNNQTGYGRVNADSAVRVTASHPFPNISITATPTNVCNGGSSTLSASATIGNVGGYCIPVTTSGCWPNSTNITNVSIGTFSRSSTCDELSGSNGYSLFTSPNPNFTAGAAMPLSVSVSGFVGVAMWIDYNQNNNFESNELILNGYTGLAIDVYNTNITIPTTAINGATRMRVRCTLGIDPSTIGNCDAVSFGETEDYTINITGGINAFTYSWSPSNFLSSSTGNSVTTSNISANTTYTVTATHANGLSSSSKITVLVTNAITNNLISSSAQTICPLTATAQLNANLPAGGNGGFAYQWLSSSQSPTTGFNVINLANNQNYTANALNSDTWFKRKVNSGGCNDTSTAIKISVLSYKTWVGNVSSDWANPLNWNCGTVPTNSDSVVILNGVFNAEIKDSNRVVNHLTIFSNGALVMNNVNAQLSIFGKFTMIGTGALFHTKGTIKFMGNAIQNIPSNTYANLQIGNPAGVQLLNNNITVTDTLNLSGGPIYLGFNNLTMNGTSVVIKDSISRHIVTNGVGTVNIINVGIGGKTGTVRVPIGTSISSYTPITIANAGTADQFNLKVNNGVLSNGLTGTTITNNAVNKTWVVSEGVAGGSNLTVALQWNATDELNGFNRNASYVSVYNGTTWLSKASTAAIGTSTYTQTRNGISSINAFSVASNGTLPIKLISFTGNKNNNNMVLNWATASEINNDYFIVERSIDNKKFESIASKIKGIGTSNIINYYKLIDDNFSQFLNTNQIQTVYYRLRQVDFDGTINYSKSINVSINENENLFDATALPNPFNHSLNLNINSLNNAKITVQVVDISGSILHEEEVNTNEGSQIYTVPQVDKLKEGVYFLNVIQGKNKRVLKVIKCH